MAIVITQTGNIYSLSGSFDEHVDLSPLKALPKPLNLSLMNVTSINSHGVRAWLVFIQETFQTKMFFYDCSSAFIDMANMLEGFLYWGTRVDRVKSVMLPFSCAKCSRSTEISISIDKVKLFQGGALVPSQRCNSCGTILTCETNLAEYFNFLLIR